MSEFSGYGWVKVQQHKYNPLQTWEDNYHDLEKHHIEETTFLIETIRKLESRIKKQDEE